MTLLTSLLLPRRQAISGSVWTVPGAWWPQSAFSGVKTKSGEAVTVTTAMGVSAYYACVAGIAEDVAKVPLSIVRRLKPRGREVLGDHAVTVLLDEEANPWMDAFTFRETLTAWMLGWGNGYAQVERDGAGRPLALWPIHPSRVVVSQDKKTGETIYKVRADDFGASWAPIPAEDMLHLHGLGDGVEGYSVLRFAAESLGLALAGQTAAAAFYGNNLAVGTVFTSPPMETIAFEAYKKSLVEAYKGAEKTGGAVVLNGGGDVKRMGVNPDEAQALEGRQFGVEEVCRWFRRSPQKIGHTKQAQGWSTLEALQISDVTDCLLPRWVRWEKAVKRTLLRGEQALSLKHYVQGLMRGDSKARAEFYASRIQNGSMTPNEVRELEDEDPAEDDGADSLWIQGASVPLERQMEKPAPVPPPLIGVTSGGKMPGGQPTEDAAEPEDLKDGPDPAAAFRPFYLDAARRIVRKECNALDRALKKHAASDVAFREWAEGFYEEQRDMAAHEFATCAAVAVAEGAPDGLLRPFVEGLWPDPVARTGEALRRREADLATALADDAFAALNRRG